MKNKSHSRWIKWAVAIIGIVGFCMMFCYQMKSTLGVGNATNWTFQEVLFGEGGYTGATGGFIGYLLLLIGGLLVGAMGCVLYEKRRLNFVLTLLGSVIMLVGVFLVFNTVNFFVAGNANNILISKGSHNITTGEIMGGILGIFGVLAGFYAVCIDYSK